MIARPDTAAWAGSPRSACPDAASAAAPPTQKINPNAASSSANARRGSPGRSGKDRLERDADDLQPPREAVERKPAQVVLRDAEDVGGVAVAGRLERFRDVREEVAQCLLDRVRLLRVGLHRLAQEPHAVADVARLVVMDLRIAVDETWQQALASEVVGGELERRQPQGGFEDQ